MRTIVQDTVTGDWNLTGTDADYLVNTPEAVAQAVATRLGLWQGDWWLNQAAGMPWLTQVLGYGTQLLYDQAIQEQILGTPGVRGITSYSSTFNPTTRQLKVTVSLSTDYGPTSSATTLLVAITY